MRTLAGLLLLITISSEASTPLPVSVRGLNIELPLFSLFATPGEDLGIGLDSSGTDGVEAYLDERRTGLMTAGEWRFQAPAKPGLYALRIEHTASDRSVRLNLLVMQPASAVRDGKLNGYRVDSYPPPRAKTPALYQAPRGFIEVTPANRRLQLSPHFTLEQFICKQQSNYPKYLVLQERLLVLLEKIIPVVRQAGFPVQTLSPISGYRTPFYNRQIGNVPNSRHVYGDAYDWYVDADGNGRMDDINGDGKLDGGDSRALFKIMDQFLDRPANRLLVGGLGRYRPNAAHGGFVHVDTRGYRARW